VGHRSAKREEDPKGASTRMMEYSKTNLRAPDGKPFCVECLTVFWACSRKKLYPPAPKGPPEPKNSKKDISIMAWFLAQVFCLDVDPEDGKRTMPAAKKCRVHAWYMEDVEKWPECYIEATKRWFEQVWADNFPDVVCRKWLRFAKCVDCVRLRTIIADRSIDKKTRREAADELAKHYRAMKMERAYHRQ
jgi:hypothetical protein